MTRNHQVSYPRELVDRPACLKCGMPMQLLFIEEEYPGYSRRTFGCNPCDGIVTEWAPARWQQADHRP
jgi:hypothetical protein